MRKNFTGYILKDLEVTDMADEGRGLARHEGMVVFIKYAVPGDIVDVLIRKKTKSFLEGELVNLVASSPMRVEPFCVHFGICGGCKWQHLSYPAQLAFKQKQVVDAMQRIGKLDVIPVLPILGSSDTRYYRNKLDYSFADRKWLSPEEFAIREQMDGPGLGFHLSGKFDKVLDIQECHLQPDPSNAIRLAIKKYCIDHEMEFINLRNRSGQMRSLIIRNTLRGDLMVLVMVYENHQDKLNALLDFIAQSFPQITSLLYVINPKANDTFHDLEVHIFKGESYITEVMENLQFRIGAKSFFQTNSRQSYELYKIAREFAALTGNENVYDLYTGTGTIANFVAASAKHVTGIEYVEAAIEDAKLNSAVNNIHNTEFYAGDMKDLLQPSFFSAHGFPEVIITDPPRAGMHADVITQLNLCGAQRIVYVSCNPATQARDIQMMNEYYSVEKLQPVDMFPHTAHVENVALLVRR